MVRIFELNAEHGSFSDRLACVLSIVIDLCLQPLVVELIYLPIRQHLDLLS